MFGREDVEYERCPSERGDWCPSFEAPSIQSTDPITEVKWDVSDLSSSSSP